MRVFEKRFPERRWIGVLLRLALVLAVIIIITVITGIQMSKKIIVSYYSIETDITSALRLVQLTDLHNSEFGEDNCDLIARIEEEHPDAILMTGDMVDREEESILVVTNLIKNLTQIAPVYYGYGNHEYDWEEIWGKSLRDSLEDAGAIVLSNTYTDVDVYDDRYRIGGFTQNYRNASPAYGPLKTLEEKLQFAEDFEATDRYKILLNHVPAAFVYWGGADSYDIDLVFAGHFHGGIVRLPVLDKGLYSPYEGLFPRYHMKGVTCGRKVTIVQSAGLGDEHIIPRVFNPPEIVVVELEPVSLNQ